MKGHDHPPRWPCHCVCDVWSSENHVSILHSSTTYLRPRAVCGQIFVVVMQLVVAAFLLQLLHSTSSFDYHGDETGSSLVGSACSTNTDCVHGAYCRMGACNCMNSYVAVEKYCWRKISPEESGCIYDEQCGALWPGANCQSNTCKCPQPLQAAVTREGVVCHPKDECPTNGRNSLLYNRNTGTPSMCFLLNPNNQSWEFIGCDDFPEVHNCIDGLCCPTKAN
ncbi:hypothetical protein RB195_009891 [Necator americanus]|uniref:EB domain-containing protein n=1 Tax=Necator americanus TaxID=51031 RepID=A0ABR1CXA1_NECAM